MRSGLIVLAVSIGVVVCPTAPAAAEPPTMPDLRGYGAVTPDGFVVGNAAYFQTPDGLRCAIQPDRGAAGCDGRLPGAPSGANTSTVLLGPPVNGGGATDALPYPDKT
jgi:hypothetical protein